MSKREKPDPSKQLIRAVENENWKIKVHPDLLDFVKIVIGIDVANKLGDGFMVHTVDVYEFHDKVEVQVEAIDQRYDPDMSDYRNVRYFAEAQMEPIQRKTNSNIDITRLPLTMTFYFDKMNIASIVRIICEENGIDMEKFLTIRMPAISEVERLGFSKKFDFKRLIFVHPDRLSEFGYSERKKKKGKPNGETA